jgi:hypothetical protein
VDKSSFVIIYHRLILEDSANDFFLAFLISLIFVQAQHLSQIYLSLLVQICCWRRICLSIPSRVSFLLSFCGTGVWTQGLHLELLHQPFSVISFCQDRVSRIICLGWLQTTILLFFASWITRLQVWATSTRPE